MRTTILLPLLLLGFMSRAQNLEVIGKAKITEMDTVNTADSVVVWLGDSTLGIRDASTLQEFQILSFSNDTLYLSDGGFVVLPDADPTNEIQLLRVSDTLDSLFLGDQWVIVPGISEAQPEFIVDGDGNQYTFVTIGSQDWLVQNLKTTTYNDGTPIPHVTDDSTWANLTTPAYCWYDNDSATYFEPYGALYNYYVIADTNSRNACPIGWHAGSEDEWDTLWASVDTVLNLKDSLYWEAPNPGGNDAYGFSALPGGERSGNTGVFAYLGQRGTFSSSTEEDSITNLARSFFYNLNYVPQGAINKDRGTSVRCIRDE